MDQNSKENNKPQINNLFNKNDESPLVSIIIPALNEEKRISQMFTSLAKQEFPFSAEVIVVDNGCSDATASIARSYGVEVIREAKIGISIARQAGLLKAQGQIIVSTDADVIFKKNWLKNLTEPLINNKRIHLTYGVSFYPGNSGIKAIIFSSLVGILRWLLSATPLMAYGPNMAFKKEIALKVGGYDTDIRYNEDSILAYKFFKYKWNCGYFCKNAVLINSARRVQKESMLARIFKWTKRVIFVAVTNSYPKDMYNENYKEYR